MVQWGVLTIAAGNCSFCPMREDAAVVTTEGTSGTCDPSRAVSVIPTAELATEATALRPKLQSAVSSASSSPLRLSKWSANCFTAAHDVPVFFSISFSITSMPSSLLLTSSMSNTTVEGVASWW